ncbi:hypothetical protein ACP26L_36440 (plasmid) [Paenibacillus sp. S-38]|uniref:hypothetical protein n=1 Tax=Paenibacillus sp. S-38 TaxID=3416710 RepID=UPI003CEE5649
MALLMDNQVDEILAELEQTYAAGSPATRNLIATLVLDQFQRSNLIDPNRAAEALQRLLGAAEAGVAAEAVTLMRTQKEMLERLEEIGTSVAQALLVKRPQG